MSRKSATAKIKAVLHLRLLGLRLPSVRLLYLVLSSLVETSAVQEKLTSKIEVDVRVLVHAERVGKQVRGRIEVGVRNLVRLLGVEKIARMGVVAVTADAAVAAWPPPRGGKSRQRTRA